MWNVGDQHPKGAVLGVRRTEGRVLALLGSLDAEWIDVTDDAPPAPVDEAAPVLVAPAAQPEDASPAPVLPQS